MPLDALFLPATEGQRFCLFHRPVPGAKAKGAVLFVHAFAEEMNKSRRMAALQARALAAAGYGVLQIDLHGCGDSSGDFGDAIWESWVDDVCGAVPWLRERVDGPLWLWGHRAGCLLAVAAARRIDRAANFLFWQPVASGRQYLQQFLRLKLVSELMSGEAKGVTDRLRKHLAAGEAVEVAGYRLSPAMARGLEQAELLPPRHGARMEWLELAGKAEAALSPVATRQLAAWQEAGHRARARTLAGPMFWQTTEIEECPALIEATLEVVGEHG